MNLRVKPCKWEEKTYGTCRKYLYSSDGVCASQCFTVLSYFHFIWGGGDSLLHECKLCSELSSAKFAWFCLNDSHQDKRKRNQFTKIPQVLQCFAMFCLLWVQRIKEISMICLFLQHVLEYSKHLQTLSHHVDLGSDGKVSWDQPLPRWTAALPQPWREHGKRCSCGYETLGGGADSTYLDT